MPSETVGEEFKSDGEYQRIILIDL